MLEKIREAHHWITKAVSCKPELGIILGTGLGGLVKELEVESTLSYQDIPHFPVSTVEGHSGKLIFGNLEGKKVVVMQGRFHYYEGYTLQEVGFPVRVMKLLGVEKLLVSNVSGALNPTYNVGDLMILNDHINLLPGNPLVGPNNIELGPRFQDMCQVYDPALIEQGQAIAQENNFVCHQGVYVAVSGPCLETVAEYKYLRIIGADVVGMSTIPEVTVARHMEIPCFAISLITDLGIPGKIKKVTVEEIIRIATESEPKLTAVIQGLIRKI